MWNRSSTIFEHCSVFKQQFTNFCKRVDRENLCSVGLMEMVNKCKNTANDRQFTDIPLGPAMADLFCWSTSARSLATPCHHDGWRWTKSISFISYAKYWPLLNKHGDILEQQFIEALLTTFSLLGLDRRHIQVITQCVVVVCVRCKKCYTTCLVDVLTKQKSPIWSGIELQSTRCSTQTFVRCPDVHWWRRSVQCRSGSCLLCKGCVVAFGCLCTSLPNQSR